VLGASGFGPGILSAKAISRRRLALTESPTNAK
jgi:hypothetical protein